MTMYPGYVYLHSYTATQDHDEMTHRSIESLITEGALFFCSHSGGKDSQAMYSLLQLIVPHDQIIVVHAHLGEVEWAGVIDHIEANIAHSLHVAHAIYKDHSDKGLLDMVERRHAQLLASDRAAAPWPSSKQRFCTSDLKRDPIHKVIRAMCAERGISLAVNCTGIRAQESTARSKMVEFEECTRLCNQSRTVYEWRPILGLLVDEVFDVIAAAGQRPFWAYVDGNERLSCVFCIMGSPNDLAHGKQRNPELYARYVDLEKRTGYTMFHSESLDERIARSSTDADCWE